MGDGMHLMIPASEYIEMETKIERLEKALDKAISELIDEFGGTEEEWKELCMKDG